ncbi:hypothetical protein LR090_06085 [Candidatus Bipolaricaulota bacterium]|nr:hypothetical protein [Candidatus Bipolaricaulota bacterium]
MIQGRLGVTPNLTDDLEVIFMKRMGLTVAVALITVLSWGLAGLAQCAPHEVAVTFRYVPLPGEEVISVSLRGSFNNWGEWPMEQQPDGSWSITVCLAPGEYQYKYFINGQYPQDMATARGGGPVDFDAHGYVDDGFGGQNAVRKVGSFLTGRWDFKMRLLPSPEIAHNTLELTYSVAGLDITSISRFGWAHSFEEQGFTWTGLVAGTVETTGGMYFDPQAIAYKYAFLEGSFNFLGLEIAAKAEHWAEPYLPLDRCPVAVTFRYVPASGETVTSVNVAGDFDGWNPSDSWTAMSYDPATGEWSVTIYLTPGPITYKYVINGTWPGNMETDHPVTGGPVDLDAEGYVGDGFGGQKAMRIVRGTCQQELVPVTLTYRPRAWQAEIYEITVPGAWPPATGYGWWDPANAPSMTEQPDGTWSVTFYLPPGIYEYKYFIRDNTSPGGYWVPNMADFRGEGPASPEAAGYRFGNAVIFVGDPMPSYMRYTLSAQWNNLAGTVRFEDCCGIMFKDLTITLTDLSFCCGITYSAELYFTKQGFHHLKLTTGNFIPLWYDISLGLEVEYGVDYKRLSPHFSWGGISGYFTLYGDLQVNWATLDGLQLYGFKLRCDLGDCTYLEILSALNVAKIEEFLGADIFQNEEFEYVKLGFCGPAWGGGDYTLAITTFFGGGGPV